MSLYRRTQSSLRPQNVLTYTPGSVGLGRGGTFKCLTSPVVVNVNKKLNPQVGQSEGRTTENNVYI